MVASDGRSRVGLIGYGLAGSVFHAPLIASDNGLRLAAVVTADPARQARVRAAFPEAAVLDRPERLWEMASDIDLVVVATPNSSHVPLARTAIDAGLAVVVDKPLAPSFAEGRELIAAARERGVALTVFQNRRWDGDLLTVRRLLDDEVLGKVARFESRFERWRPEVEGGFRDSGAPGDAGGLLFDLGAHLIDQALLLLGPAVSVYAELDRRRPGAEIDDDAFVALAHASGARSHLWMSAVAAQVGPRMRVLGDRAAFVKDGLDVQEGQLVEGMRPGDPGYGDDPPDRWGRLGTDGDLRRVPTERGAYERFYDGVAAALRGEAPMPVDPLDALAVLRIVEAGHRSAATGETVRLEGPERGAEGLR
jgi:predicted dehydrogenase